MGIGYLLEIFVHRPLQQEALWFLDLSLSYMPQMNMSGCQDGSTDGTYLLVEGAGVAREVKEVSPSTWGH